MKTYFATDIGKRTNNEDTVAIVNTKENETLMVVCDGMGGHNSGELASKMVSEYLVDCYKTMPPFINQDEAKKWMNDAIHEAHHITKRFSYTSIIHAGMGTTVVCALIMNQSLLVASVGDSRCYVVDENIHLLTEDDTFVNELLKSGLITSEQARNHDKKNILMKAIGVSDTIDTHVGIYDLNIGYVLLCSDGLYNSVTDVQIKQVLLTKASLEEKGDALILLAKRQGGNDNITVALANIERGDINERNDHI